MGRKVLYLIALSLILGVLLLSLDAYADRRARETLEDLLRRLDLEERASYGEVGHSLLRGETRIRDLSVRTEDGLVRVEELVIHRLTEEDIKLSFLGITSTDKDFREFRKNMRDLGYEDVKMNLFIDVKTDRKRGDLRVRDISLEVPEAFRLSLKADIGNLSFSLLEKLEDLQEEDLPEVTEKLGRVRIRSFEFSVTDLGLRERALRREAEERNMSPEKLKEEILRDLERSVKESDPGIKRELVSNLRNFIDKGGTLRVVAEPETPVSVSDLVLVILVSAQTKDLSQVVEMLNLKVERKK
jgi:hypothetical protein